MLKWIYQKRFICGRRGLWCQFPKAFSDMRRAHSEDFEGKNIDVIARSSNQCIHENQP